MNKKRRYSESTRRKVYLDHCFYCGRKLTDGNRSIDHIHPLSKGGTNSSPNMVTCCKKCNTLKGNMTIPELILKLQHSLGYCTDDDAQRKKIEMYIRIFTAAQSRLPTLGKRHPKKKYSSAGYCPTNKYVPLIKKDGGIYALYGWDGERYTECWRHYGDYGIETKDSFTITPIYAQSGGIREIIDYEIRQN